MPDKPVNSGAASNFGGAGNWVQLVEKITVLILGVSAFLGGKNNMHTNAMKKVKSSASSESDSCTPGYDTKHCGWVIFRLSVSCEFQKPAQSGGQSAAFFDAAGEGASGGG